jgi:hypothetical protein
MVKSVLMYGSETWAMTDMDIKRPGTWERKILRISGSAVEQGKRKIRSNRELKELHNDLDKVGDIKKKLKWTGLDTE